MHLRPVFDSNSYVPNHNRLSTMLINFVQSYPSIQMTTRLSQIDRLARSQQPAINSILEYCLSVKIETKLYYMQVYSY